MGRIGLCASEEEKKETVKEVGVSTRESIVAVEEVSWPEAKVFLTAKALGGSLRVFRMVRSQPTSSSRAY